jgi:hypothetical protein
VSNKCINGWVFQGVWLGVSDDITCVEQVYQWMSQDTRERMGGGYLAKFMQYHDCLIHTLSNIWWFCVISISNVPVTIDVKKYVRATDWPINSHGSFGLSLCWVVFYFTDDLHQTITHIRGCVWMNSLDVEINVFLRISALLQIIIIII